jgi:hypothetical protein
MIAGGGKTTDVTLCSIAAGITYGVGIDLTAYQFQYPVKGFGHGPVCKPCQPSQAAQRGSGQAGRVCLHSVKSSFVLLRLSFAAAYEKVSQEKTLHL